MTLHKNIADSSLKKNKNIADSTARCCGILLTRTTLAP